MDGLDKKSQNFVDNLYECFLVVPRYGRTKGNLKEPITRTAFQPYCQCCMVVTYPFRVLQFQFFKFH